MQALLVVHAEEQQGDFLRKTCSEQQQELAKAAMSGDSKLEEAMAVRTPRGGNGRK